LRRVKAKSVVWALLILAFVFQFGRAEQIDFGEIFDKILAVDPAFQMKRSELQQKTAHFGIDSANNFFNLSYERNANSGDVKRSEQKADGSENITIVRTEKTDKFVISKVFFEQDFNSAFDIISEKNKILDLKFDLEIYRIKRLDEIISEFMKIHKAEKKLEIESEKLSLLKQEKEISEILYADGVISEDKLIEIHRKIPDVYQKIYEIKTLLKEKEISDFRLLNLLFSNLSENLAEIADTTSFVEKNTELISSRKKQMNKLASALQWKRFATVLPEMKAEVSWNKKTVTENRSYVVGNTGNILQRDDAESYPELALQFSLPLNFIGNSSNKIKLLQSFRNELIFSEKEFSAEIHRFQNKMLFALKQSYTSLNSKIELAKLYREKFRKAQQQYDSEPSLLGTTPEIFLKYRQLDREEAELEMKFERLNLKKTIFLINYYVRTNYVKK